MRKKVSRVIDARRLVFEQIKKLQTLEPDSLIMCCYNVVVVAAFSSDQMMAAVDPEDPSTV